MREEHDTPSKQSLKDKVTKNLAGGTIVAIIFFLFVGYVAYNSYVNRTGLYSVKACLVNAGDKTGETFTDPTDGSVTEFREDICRDLEANTDLATYAKLWLPNGKTVDITCDPAGEDNVDYNCHDEDDNAWTLEKIKRLGNER